MVFLNPQEYTAFTHGYAMSIHKSEGSTFDKSYVLANRFMTPETTLVAMTRHRHDVGLYVSRTQFIDFKDLVETRSRGRAPDILSDYQISPDQQPYFDRVRQYTDLMVEAVTLREEMEGLLEPDEPLFKHPAYDSYQGIYQHKKEVAAETSTSGNLTNPMPAWLACVMTCWRLIRDGGSASCQTWSKKHPWMLGSIWSLLGKPESSGRPSAKPIPGCWRGACALSRIPGKEIRSETSGLMDAFKTQNCICPFLNGMTVKITGAIS